MTHRVDTWMQAMQPPRPQPNFNAPPADSQPPKLPPRHHPMLPPGQLRDPDVRCTRLL